MTKTPAKNQAISAVESDVWRRFERAVDVVAKSPPQHRVKPATKKRKVAAGKAAKKT